MFVACSWCESVAAALSRRTAYPLAFRMCRTKLLHERVLVAESGKKDADRWRAERRDNWWFDFGESKFTDPQSTAILPTGSHSRKRQGAEFHQETNMLELTGGTTGVVGGVRMDPAQT